MKMIIGHFHLGQIIMTQAKDLEITLKINLSKFGSTKSSVLDCFG